MPPTKSLSLFLIVSIALPHCLGAESPVKAERWKTLELEFQSSQSYENPYTDAEFWAIFENERGELIKRPGFWDGGESWKLRFAPPFEGEWTYSTFSSDTDNSGLHGRSGRIDSRGYKGGNPLLRHGLLRMSPSGRNIIHADGTPFFMVADTPWALPFRATEETVATYAGNRQQRGFNAALLMAVQPDRNARGPRDRTLPESFGVGFEDLPQGRLNHLNPAYFQLLDKLVGTLIDHSIVPVYSPVFQGFGWKGLHSLGSGADPEEYVRFQVYLIARYGSYPAIWLASADATGRDPVVEPAGEAIELWDAYQQPTGIHYSPWDDSKADWSDDPRHGLHFNRIHQDKHWLDFQWAQTGHGAKHLPEKLALMWQNLPKKAVANGEPTYERMGEVDRASGWWQGHEAWLNLVSGGTMGVVYGAGGLWNWKLSHDESGWPDWANTEASWTDAIDFEGSRYVGYLSKALAGMPITDMDKRPDLANGFDLLAKEELFYLSYLPNGGAITIKGVPIGMTWRWFDPKSGTFTLTGATVQEDPAFQAPAQGPWVLILGVPLTGAPDTSD